MTIGRRLDGSAPSSARWEWGQTALLVATLAWTTLCLGGYRPETLVVTSALTGALLATHCAAGARGNRSRRSLHPAGLWLLPFVGYAALNVVFVSPVPWLGWLDWLKWANGLAVFWVVLNGIRSPAARRALFLALVVLGLVGVLLASYQRFVRPDWLMLGRRQVEQFIGRASGPFGIPNSLGGFLLLLLPVTAARMCRRDARATGRVWWTWVTAVLGFGLLLTVSRGAWIALALACVGWPFLHPSWSWVRRATWAAAIFGAAIGVSAIAYELSPRMHERFDLLVRDSGELSRPILWRAAWGLFRERPFVGTGAGSYNVLFERQRPAGFVDEPQWAHNDYLNTLSDYGLIGFALLVGAVGVIVWRQCRRDPDRDAPFADGWEGVAFRRALGIGLLAFALQLGVDFHFKIPALGLAFAAVAGLACGGNREKDGRTPMAPSRASQAGWIAAGALSIVATFSVARFHRGEALRYQARQAIDAYARDGIGDLAVLAGDAEAKLRRATVLSPGNGGAWADLAFAVELQAIAAPARVLELGGPAEAAARRATALSAVVPEFWIRLGVALDMQRRRAEARAAFEQAVRLAPRSLPGWYYYAYHLSLDTKDRDEALRAIANCLSLDAGNRAAEALRAKLNARPPGALIVP